MYHYFYKITNLINNHFYYGVHNTDNLDDGYMGSGKRLHKAYEKYGIQNFKKEILKFFSTSEEAFSYESAIVDKKLVDDSNCYNLTSGGRAWNNTGLILVKLSGKDDYFFISKERYDENRELYDTTWTGRHHRKESRNKTRKSMTPKNSTNNRVWVSNNKGITKYLRKDLLDEYLSNGWELGRINYKPRKNSQGKQLLSDNKLKTR